MHNLLHLHYYTTAPMHQFV